MKTLNPFFFDENTGSAAIPRNVGIEMSTADYLMFLDPDDEFMPDFCETIYAQITANDVEIVKCNFIMIRDEKIIHNNYFDKKISKKLIKNSDLPLKYVTIWNGIHKSSFIKENEITFPNCTGEDVYFTTDEVLKMDKMLYLNDYFGYKYFDRDDSHSRKPTKLEIMSLLRVFELTRDNCLDHNREDVMSVILGQQIIGLFTRINNVDSLEIKRELLIDSFKFRTSISYLSIPSVVYKLADSLLMKKLIYLTILYLKLAPKMYHSKFLSKLMN